MKTFHNDSDTFLKYFVCIVAVLASVFAILHGPTDAATKNWAFGTIGLILGRVLSATNSDRRTINSGKGQP
ncbi:MAG TPA: hypothetical protein VNW47_17210 [Terriglobales bacterium]|jgi:hypothetical protein|nr:hypothetical protein [Terriglobales bacterium]